MVAVTIQVPALVVVSEELVTRHPVAVPPASTAYITAPLPVPPDVVRVRGTLNVPEMVAIVRAACAAKPKVSVT